MKDEDFDRFHVSLNKREKHTVINLQIKILLFFTHYTGRRRCLVVLLLKTDRVCRYILLHSPKERQSAIVLACLSPLNNVRILVDWNQMGSIGFE